MRRPFILIILFIITLLLLCFNSQKLSAQSTKNDSLKRAAFSRDSIFKDSLADINKIRIKAKQDARKLRLSAQQQARFNADKKNTRSDFFKPTAALASDENLLQDSVYVRAFRMAAYNKAVKYRKRTVGHYVLMGGIVVGSLGALVIIIAVISISTNGVLGKN